MAQANNLDFNIAMHTKGMEQIATLINRVDALEAATRKLQTANSGLSASTDAVIRNGTRYNNAMDAQSKAMRQARQGSQQLGMQFNDLATSISTGANPIQAFNQQLGQIGYAMEQMGGITGKVGAFIAGPWGAAIVMATMLLGPYIEKLLGVGEASRDAALGANQLQTEQSSLATVQSALGDMFDLSTGKIANNTNQVRLNTLAMLLNNQEKAKALALEGKKVLDTAVSGKKPLFSFDFGAIISGPEMVRQAKNVQNLKQFAITYKIGAMSAEQALIQASQLDLRGTGMKLDTLRQSILDIENARALGKDTAEAMNGFTQGVLSARLLKPEKTKTPKTTKPKVVSETDKLRAEQQAIIDQFKSGSLSAAEFETQLKAVTDSYKEAKNPAQEYLKEWDRQDQVAKKFRDTVQTLSQKTAPEWENRLNDLTAQYKELSATTRLTTADTESFNKSVTALLTGPINEQIKKYDELIAKANGVDDSFGAMRAAIVARAVEQGIGVEEVMAKLDILDQKQADLKIAERNADIKKSFEAVGNAVSDSFKGMITGATSWKDAMKSLIGSVIDELWRLYVVKQIVGFVTKLAGGGQSFGGDTANLEANFDSVFKPKAVGGYVGAQKPYLVGERGPELFVPGGSGTIIPNKNMGAGGGITKAIGGITKAIGGITGNAPVPEIQAVPEFMKAANGTINSPGGLTWVGERGPELVNLPRGSQVIPAHRAQNMAGSGVTVNVDARGSADPAAVRAQVEAGILQAAPAIIAAAQQRTVSGLRRPKLGGVMQ